MTPAEQDPALWVAKSLHRRLVFPRRGRVLSTLLAALLPNGATVLDVGCGDGTIAHLIMQMNPTTIIRGLEVAPRPSCRIEYEAFDGASIPLGGDSVDVCMFVDVLHHTHNIVELLKEARRVARRHVLIKDHLCENQLDGAILKFMDAVGNPRSVRMVHNYKNRADWAQIFSACGLRIASWNDRLGLYPPPFNAIFGRRLHYVGLFEKG